MRHALLLLLVFAFGCSETTQITVRVNGTEVDPDSTLVLQVGRDREFAGDSETFDIAPVPFPAEVSVAIVPKDDNFGPIHALATLTTPDGEQSLRGQQTFVEGENTELLLQFGPPDVPDASLPDAGLEGDAGVDDGGTEMDATLPDDAGIGSCDVIALDGDANALATLLIPGAPPTELLAIAEGSIVRLFRRSVGDECFIPLASTLSTSAPALELHLNTNPDVATLAILTVRTAARVEIAGINLSPLVFGTLETAYPHSTPRALGGVLSTVTDATSPFVLFSDAGRTLSAYRHPEDGWTSGRMEDRILLDLWQNSALVASAGALEFVRFKTLSEPPERTNAYITAVTVEHGIVIGTRAEPHVVVVGRGGEIITRRKNRPGNALTWQESSSFVLMHSPIENMPPTHIDGQGQHWAVAAFPPDAPLAYHITEATSDNPNIQALPLSQAGESADLAIAALHDGVAYIGRNKAVYIARRAP